MPSAWGHTRLLETDWRLITQESHCFSGGSVKGLPNQTYLEDYLEEFLTHGKQKKVALMMLNCNNFKVLNMTYGYRYGNDILKEMAKKLGDITG